MSRYSVFLIFFILVTLTGFQLQEPQSSILLGLKNNSSKAIVKHFSSSVNLSLHSESRICNKFQSELMLTEFFQQNKIQNVKIISTEATKTNRLYVVYEVKTEDGTFQILVKFMDIKGEPTVVEFVIC